MRAHTINIILNSIDNHIIASVYMLMIIAAKHKRAEIERRSDSLSSDSGMLTQHWGDLIHVFVSGRERLNGVGKWGSVIVAIQ